MRIERSSLRRLVAGVLLAAAWGCSRQDAPAPADKGPHGGKLLSEDGFAVEVRIFEQGVPPEFRLYGFEGGKPVGPETFDAVITLARLDATDRIEFAPHGEYLLGDKEIYEPHSFDVTVAVTRDGGPQYEWKYSSYEGRTEIPEEEVKGAAITIERVEPRIMKSVVELTGEIALNADRTAHVVPRLAGVVSDVRKNLGDRVSRGEVLAVIDSGELAAAKQALVQAASELALASSVAEREETLFRKRISPEEDYLMARQRLEGARITHRASAQRLSALGLSASEVRSLESAGDASLTRYEVRSPIGGVVIAKDVTVGEAVQGTDALFTVGDLSTVWTEIAVPPDHLADVAVGQDVIVRSDAIDSEATGTVAHVGALMGSQSRSAAARVVIANDDGRWRPGLFVTVKLTQKEESVPMVVRAEAIQTFRDWDVVFIRVGDLFEARPVELGRRDGAWVEVLAGVRPGQEYAATNSFVVKADVLKSGASHDH